MALSRFVVISTVTTTPDTLATPVPGDPATGGAAGYGNSATVVAVAGSESKYGLWPQTFLAGTVIVADSTADGIVSENTPESIRAYSSITARHRGS